MHSLCLLFVHKSDATSYVSNTNRQIVVVMIHISSQDDSYNQDYSLFFIVHEVV